MPSVAQTRRAKLLADKLYKYFAVNGYANQSYSADEGEYSDVCIDGYYNLEELAQKILEDRWSK